VTCEIRSLRVCLRTRTDQITKVRANEFLLAKNFLHLGKDAHLGEIDSIPVLTPGCDRDSLEFTYVRHQHCRRREIHPRRKPRGNKLLQTWQELR
jgi:hypothetical protein